LIFIEKIFLQVLSMKLFIGIKTSFACTLNLEQAKLNSVEYTTNITNKKIEFQIKKSMV